MSTSLLVIVLLLILLFAAIVVFLKYRRFVAATQKCQPITIEQQRFFSELSQDSTYGYTIENPIKVGGYEIGSGPSRERAFLNALAGPKGEQIAYQRLGSGPIFETENGEQGLLDSYEIRWNTGTMWNIKTESLILYFNMYDYGTLSVPIGFSIRG